MKILKKLVAVMVLGLVLGGCSNDSSEKKTEATDAKTEQSTKAKDDNEQKVTIKLVIDDKEETKKEVSFEEGQSLAEVMDANFEMSDDNGMISSIDGHEQDAKNSKYWLYQVNGKDATTAASDVELKSGDEIVWTLNQLEIK